MGEQDAHATRDKILILPPLKSLAEAVPAFQMQPVHTQMRWAATAFIPDKQSIIEIM